MTNPTNIQQQIQKIKQDMENEKRELATKEKKYSDNEITLGEKRIEIVNLQKSHDAMRMEIMNLERIQPSLKNEIDHLKKEVSSHELALRQAQ
jgi:chromosome segregation ATPase